VRIARSDGDYESVEIDRIDAVLAHRYDLSPSRPPSCAARPNELEEEAPDTVRFTRAIKDAVPYDDRVKVIESLWDIVLADGERDHEEDAILRLVAPMLGVNDRDSNLARKRVEAIAGHDRLPADVCLPADTAAAEARLWSGIRDRLRAMQGIDAPDSLTLGPGDLRAHWTDPASSCRRPAGGPTRTTSTAGPLVGTPDYGLEGLPTRPLPEPRHRPRR
jgi:uncharacterized tellurite resistance protein B-like protein